MLSIELLTDDLPVTPPFPTLPYLAFYYHSHPLSFDLAYSADRPRLHATRTDRAVIASPRPDLQHRPGSPKIGNCTPSESAPLNLPQPGALFRDFLPATKSISEPAVASRHCSATISGPIISSASSPSLTNPNWSPTPPTPALPTLSFRRYNQARLLRNTPNSHTLPPTFPSHLLHNHPIRIPLLGPRPGMRPIECARQSPVSGADDPRSNV